MNSCSNCESWLEFSADDVGMPDGVRSGKCCKIPHFSDVVGYDEDFEGIELTSDSKAFARDGSGYYSDLLTMHDFSCNMHEEKISEAPKPAKN